MPHCAARLLDRTLAYIAADRAGVPFCCQATTSAQAQIGRSSCCIAAALYPDAALRISCPATPAASRGVFMATVTIRGVEKLYGPVKVIHGIDVEIGDGEFVVLVGPSGCGKSTLLRMIAGLEEISAGEISIAGKVVNDVTPRDRDVAMVFQNYALYPHKTVFDNMGFGLKLRKADRKLIEERVKKAADIPGLPDLLGRYPRQLSGGQRQRVAMGRAIVRDPQVFLFDEPLSNLDAKLRAA